MNKQEILNLKLEEHQVAIYYLGQIGYLISFHNYHILVDPYLTDYVDQVALKNGKKNTWVRRYPSPIAPEEMDFVDAVFCTHDHNDHADPLSLTAIAKVNPKAVFYGTPAVCNKYRNFGLEESRVVETICGKSIQLTPEISVMPIPAAHEELHLDEKGCYMEAGFRFDFGGITLYHSGDCCPYDGLEENIGHADIVIAPVNGRDYYRLKNNIIGCFTVEETLLLARHVGCRLLIPAHYDLYDVNCIHPGEFVERLYSMTPGQNFHMFMPGERYIYSAM